MKRSILYLCLLVMSAVDIIAQDNVEQLDLTLRNQKYQALPTEVHRVFIDQSKRVWHILRSAHPSESSGVSQCKAEIKAQFSKQQPILKLVRPVLFGPGVMIWFSPNRNPKLIVIGYDGTKFVDHESTEKACIVGTPTNSSSRLHVRCNLQTPTALFFITNKGVLVYHKNTFSHRLLGGLFNFSSCWLTYDPKSKQVLAVKGGTLRSEGLNSVHLWKDGKWRKLDLPKSKEESRKGGLIVISGNTRKEGLRHAFFHQGNVQFLRDNTPVRRGKHILREPPPIVLGKYACKSLEFLCHHGDSIYLTSTEILVDNKSQGPGIIVGKTDGSYDALLLKDPPTRRGVPSTPVVCDGKMWCNINRTTCLLDLKTGRIIDRLEEPGFIQAVSDDRVYFGTSPTLLYQSDAPETRQALPVLKTLKDHRGKFSEDGILYIQDPTIHDSECREYRYDYYDGEGWHEPNLRFADVGGCLMGRNRTFLDINGNRKREEWRLLKDDKVIDTNTFFELIQRNKNIVSENISDARLGETTIVTNGPNQIWARRRDKARVLCGETWIDISAELKKRDLLPPYFTRMDNGCMYLSTASRGAKGLEFKGFVASVKNGELKLQPAPFGHAPSSEGYVNVRDSKALWLNAVDSAESGRSFHGKPVAIRMNSKGVLQTVKHKGHASVYDEIGNVWIGIRSPYLAVDKGIYHIWRGGEIVSSIRIPGGNRVSAFFSDKPGSVYVSTRLGLHHYMTNSQDPTKYSLHKTYCIPRGSVEFSQRGFIVINRRSYDPSIVALPKN